MATQRLAPDAILSLTNLTGAVSAIQDDPDAPDGSWLTAPDSTLSTEAYVSLPTPSGPPVATSVAQNIHALVRKVGGTGSPTARIEVWESGVQKFIGTDTSITSTAGVVLVLAWTYGPVFASPDGSGVEVKVIGTAAGGKPAARAAVEVGAVEWNVQYTASLPNINVTSTVSGTGSISDSSASSRRPSSTVTASSSASAAILTARSDPSSLAATASVAAAISTGRTIIATASGIGQIASSVTQSVSVAVTSVISVAASITAAIRSARSTPSAVSATSGAQHAATTDRRPASSLAALSSFSVAASTLRSVTSLLAAVSSIASQAAGGTTGKRVKRFLLTLLGVD